jgi:hypothetical protein
MLFRFPRLTFFARALGVLSMALVGSSLWAAEPLEDPKKLCAYFESLGMKAQMHWNKAANGNIWYCQYADEFSSRTTHVRGAQAYIDADEKTVGVGLSIQAIGSNLVRVEVAEKLTDFVQSLYSAHGKPLPAQLPAALKSKTATVVRDGKVDISNSEESLWVSQNVVGLTMKMPATAAQIARLKTEVNPYDTAAMRAMKKQLEGRCDAAIASSGKVMGKASSRQVTLLSASRFLVQQADKGGEFSCQVCDEDDPKINCGSMGVLLSYTPKGGTPMNLPAELDRKCIFNLQRNLMDDDAGSFIDHEIVRNITTQRQETDTRIVYTHSYEGSTYRCVIRKSDFSYSLDEQQGAQWVPIAAGVMW